MELNVSRILDQKYGIWYQINLKEKSESDKFKKAIKQWKPEDCPCRLCKVFVQNAGFLGKITGKK